MRARTMSRPTVASTHGIYEETHLGTTGAKTPLLKLGLRDWKDTTVVWGLSAVCHTVYQGVIPRRFQQLVEQWTKETLYMSSLTAMEAHPAYSEIIDMGEAVVPLILRELEKEPNYWFAALTEITGEDPIPEEARGRMKEMTDAWLEWEREQNNL